MNDSSDLYIPLARHSYPIGTKIFLYIIACGIFIYIPYFLYFEATAHYECCKSIRTAKDHFLTKNYTEALPLYKALIEKYPHYRQGKIILIKILFSTINEDKEYDFSFSEGICTMSGLSLTKDELEELAEYLPDSYKKTFNFLYIQRRS